jgi:hypothetical protein
MLADSPALSNSAIQLFEYDTPQGAALVQEFKMMTGLYFKRPFICCYCGQTLFDPLFSKRK